MKLVLLKREALAETTEDLALAETIEDLRVTDLKVTDLRVTDSEAKKISILN